MQLNLTFVATLRVNPHIHTRHRVVRTGNLLIEGPFSIKPPPAIDDYGWLEAELRLSHWRADGVIESIAIYVDDSTNREEAFLPPMIRSATWNNKSDDIRRALAGDLAWPNVNVSLSYVGAAEGEVDAIVRGIQVCLARVPFVPVGLVADRSLPDLPPEPRGRLAVYTRNGLQAVEVELWTRGTDAALNEAILDGLDSLRSFVRPIDTAGWRESYRFPITRTDILNFDWWDYLNSPGT